MALDIDVLITFAEKDNESQSKKDLGWVSQFKRFLELMLLQVLGRKPNVVLKKEFDSVAASTLGNVAVLVAVLSKDFIESDHCLNNVEQFHKATEPSKFSRVFKVIKSPLSLQDQPSSLGNLLRYDMYQLDADTGLMKEYSNFFSHEAGKQYWMKMVDLAYDIHEALIVLGEGHGDAGVKTIFKRKTIYLAETSHDLSVQRNIIKRELQRHGYVVLPSHTLPTQSNNVEKVIKKYLEVCRLSVHLVGSTYGEIPEGANESIVDIQNRLAAEQSTVKKSAKKEFSRLIWISPNLKNASDRQMALINTLKRDMEAQEGAEILQTPLEDFKNIMREELMDDVHDRITNEEVDGKLIYLIHDRLDSLAVQPFKKEIESNGFNVLEPSFEGDLMEVRKNHIDNLRTLDGAVIFKDKVNDQWVRMKVLDLLKAPGFGRKKPILGKAIISRSNRTSELDAFKNQNLTLISGNKDKSIKSMKVFLSEITS